MKRWSRYKPVLPEVDALCGPYEQTPRRVELKNGDILERRVARMSGKTPIYHWHLMRDGVELDDGPNYYQLRWASLRGDYA